MRCGSFACFECVGASPDRVCARCRYRTTGAPGSKMGHVPVLGALTIAHGVMLVLYSLIWLMIAGMFPFMPQQPSSTGSPPPPPELMIGIFGCFGAFHFVPGMLQLVGGIQMMRFKSRALAYVALASSVVTIVGCYCLPTALALMIWGLIVLSDPEVRQRFDAPPEPA